MLNYDIPLNQVARYFKSLNYNIDKTILFIKRDA